MPAHRSPSPVFRHHDDNGLAAYVFHSRYARFDAEHQRRETFAEAVERVEGMHRRKFEALLTTRLQPAFADETPQAIRTLLETLLGNAPLDTILRQAFVRVREKRLLPSLRTLQFGGEPILRNPARLFNCAFSPVDRTSFFGEYFFLLLSGTGCGFSVQREHIARLPVIPLPDDVIETHTVEDSIEGWADACGRLVGARYRGHRIQIDYGAIRPQGAPLVTSGGVAPGPEPLRRALVAADRILAGAAGRRLRPIEIYDLCMAVAQAVLSGGGRRSASICLFSPDDEEMARAKTGDWRRNHPQRATSNNSAVILRATADQSRFRHLLHLQQEFGEPGFYFTEHADYGCNPCGEAGLHPVFSPPHPPNLERFLRDRGWDGAWSEEARLSGWQMCNLTTVNGRAASDASSFLEAVIHAAVIGSLQATYTDIPRLGPVTRALNDHDALLGVSICGLMDNPHLLLDARLLEIGAETARWVNAAMATLLGARSAARVTCVKPEGTASLLLGTAAGVHPYPSRRYFRRIRAARDDPVFLSFAASNPEMVEDSASHPGKEAVLVFPVEAPVGAEVGESDDALQFLKRVRFMQQHWVLPGENPAPRSPGLHHTVSHSCPVRASEWSAVADYLWAHREEFSGVTLFGEHVAERYSQPPQAPARTAADAALWNRLACRPVVYTSAGAPTLHALLSAPCADGVFCATH